MKIILMGVVCLICTIHTSLAQNNINPPKAINKNSFPNAIRATPTTLHRGWNWGTRSGDNGHVYDTTYHFTTHHRHIDLSTLSNNDILDGQLHNLYIHGTSGSDRGGGPLSGMSMRYEPTLTVDTTEGFTPRWCDQTGAVFGFRYRNFTIGDTANSGIDQDRFILDSSKCANSALVLKNIWLSKHIFRWQNITKSSDTIFDNSSNDVDENSKYDTLNYHPYNGKRWMLTLNMRARDVTQLQRHLDDTLLSVRIPCELTTVNTPANCGIYPTTKQTVYAKFNQIPAGTAPAQEIRGTVNADRRGWTRPLATAPPNTTTLYITGRMLSVPPDTAIGNSITLSGFMIFDGVPTANGYRNNARMMPINIRSAEAPTGNPWNKVTYNEYITDLDIEVTYHGKADVAIDYVRMETPQAQALFRGQRDSVIQALIVPQLNAYTTWNANPTNKKQYLHRFYAVEESSHFMWDAQRYFNLLTDTLASAELGVEGNLPCAHFAHSTQLRELWHGGNLQLSVLNPAPFVRNANFGNGNDAGTFRYLSGYRGSVDNSGMYNAWSQLWDFTDTTKSDYELEISRGYQKVPLLDIFTTSHHFHDSLYSIAQCPNVYWLGYAGVQYEVEHRIYESYYRTTGMLYRHKSWWQNLWLGSDGWNSTIDKQNILNFKHRPMTGEEMTLCQSVPLILGAKGFYYYGTTPDGDMDEPGTLSDGGFSLGYHNRYRWGSYPRTGKALIYDDSIGGDYMDYRDTTFIRWGKYWHPAVYNWNMLSCDSNHIYIGTTTTRFETERFCRYLANNEQELLALRLQAWYGKGFTRMYSQHPSYPANDTILKSKFVNLSQVKTRPIGRVNVFGEPMYEQFNGIGLDSGFYDITLLKHDSLGMDSVFYLGAVNRRTDPLWRDSSYAGGEMIFVPTAEFGTLMQNGGRFWKEPTVTKSAAWWKDKFWKRQGCREITIPFSFAIPSNCRRAFLRVRELTAPGVTGIDTLICRECPLAVNFQPGEGKMFRVTIDTTYLAPNYTIADSGSLESNSQRKLVTVPLCSVTTSGQPIYDQTKVVHHLVYHIMDTIQHRDDNNNITILQRRKVFYQRSEAMDVCSPKDGLAPLDNSGKQIIWQQPQLVSSMILKEYTDSNQCTRSFVDFLPNHDCAYPSLTVRWDNASKTEKVYIVYGCQGGSPIAPIALNRNAVVECEFSSQGLINPSEDNQIIARLDSANDVSKPVIGSAVYGNYIAYSDNHVIRTIYQNPNRDLRCNNPLGMKRGSLSWYQSNAGGACSASSVALNPTINTFTHPNDMNNGLGTNNGCTVAWQESLSNCSYPFEDPVWQESHIYLARINPKDISGTILQRGKNDTDSLPLSTDGTVVRMSRSTTQIDNFHNHSMPSIAQMTEPAHDSIFNAIRVGWSAKNTSMVPGETFCGIFTVSMWFELAGATEVFNTTLRTRSWERFEFERPNLTTSRQSEGTAGYGMNRDNYTLNANLGGDSIIQFTFNRLGYSMTVPDSVLIFRGRNPQLTAQPMTNLGNYWTRVRRVVNIKDSVNSTTPEKWKIRSSHELLFKRDTEEDQYKIIPMQGYLTKKSFVYMYDNSTDPDVSVDDKWKKSMRIKDKNNEPSPMVETNWHKVGSEFTMPILLCGTGLETANLHVENRRTKARASILTKFKNAPNPHEPLRVSLRLQNGGGDEYRLVLNQADVISKPVSDIFIGRSSAYSAKTTDIEDSAPIEVDLRETVELHDGNMLSVFPDPNNGENMTVQIHPALVRNSRGNYKVSVLNGIGQVVHSVVVPVMGNVSLGEMSLPNGVYHIRCEYTTSEYDIRMATTSVVVVR